MNASDLSGTATPAAEANHLRAPQRPLAQALATANMLADEGRCPALGAAAIGALCQVVLEELEDVQMMLRPDLSAAQSVNAAPTLDGAARAPSTRAQARHLFVKPA